MDSDKLTYIIIPPQNTDYTKEILIQIILESLKKRS